MKLYSLLPGVAAGAATVLVAVSSWAVTLGQVQGVPLVGRPLEVSVPLALGPGETVDPSCVQAEVLYGDDRVDPSRVNASLRADGAGAVVQVRASLGVNEPVVTLQLQVGCASRLTRRFVLLAEQPDLSAQPVPSNFRPPAVQAPPPAASLPSTVAPRNPAPRPSAGPGGSAGPAPAGVANPLKRNPPARPGPRLQLEPLDLSSAAEPTLRLSGEMAVPQEMSAEQRARAAALWRALSMRPEDALRETQRIEALEKDFAALRQSLQRSDAAVAALRTELEAERAARYNNPVVLGLVGLLLAVGTAAVVGWRRSGRRTAAGGDWWRAQEVQDSDLVALYEDSVARGAPPAAPAPQRHGAAVGAPADVGQASIVAAEWSAPAANPSPQPVTPVMPVAPASAAPRVGAAVAQPMPLSDFEHSDFPGARAVSAEELHDVQQEVDFFLSLGDSDRAIAVLRNHISLNPDTSAVAWLDLLEIHHKLQRREDYEAVRGEFLGHFNVQVPAFEAYRERHAGLEAYPNAMARIVVLWPSSRVLGLIEESIFRKPGQGGAEAFSVEAYRDLLMLYQIGSEVTGASTEADADTDNPGGGDFTNTEMHPLSAHAVLELPTIEDSGAQVLDLNLDDMVPDPDAAGTPQVQSPASGNLLDFDLPDAEPARWMLKKTRE